MTRKNTISDFWKYVNKTEDCWEWVGYKHKQGYGRFNLLPRQHILTHRLSYELEFGAIPNGLDVMHLCDNTSCVNPAHLALGTHQDNMRDMARKGRVSQGEEHPFSKLTAADVWSIRAAKVALNISDRELASIFGVSKSGISRIVNGFLWKNV